MVRKVDCRKYRKWQKERAMKLKKTKEKVVKRKKKESVTDCIDEDDTETSTAKTVTKISYRRCKKETKKKRKPSRLVRKIVKHIPPGELILKCIKPSVEDRNYFFYRRHNICLGHSLSKIAFLLEDVVTSTSELSSTNRRKDQPRIKPCGKKKTEESESDDSDCDSICSFDSDICLAGVKLTAKDKDEIKKLQHEAE